MCWNLLLEHTLSVWNKLINLQTTNTSFKLHDCLHSADSFNSWILFCREKNVGEFPNVEREANLSSGAASPPFPKSSACNSPRLHVNRHWLTRHDVPTGYKASGIHQESGHDIFSWSPAQEVHPSRSISVKVMKCWLLIIQDCLLPKRFKGYKCCIVLFLGILGSHGTEAALQWVLMNLFVHMFVRGCKVTRIILHCRMQ